jgi:two-component system phosphate regulon sensor histidine kinase PhoR
LVIGFVNEFILEIILVQVYWFNTSFKKMMSNLFHVTQVMGNVAAKLQKQEAYSFMINTIIIKIVLVKFRKKDDLLEFYYVQKNTRTNKTIVYSNIVSDYKISSAFFDKKLTNV